MKRLTMKTGLRRAITAVVLMLLLMAVLLYGSYVRHCYVRQSVILIGAFSAQLGVQERNLAINQGLSALAADTCYQDGISALHDAGYAHTYSSLLLRHTDSAHIAMALFFLCIAGLLVLLWRNGRQTKLQEIQSVTAWLQSDTAPAPDVRAVPAAVMSGIEILKQQLSRQHTIHEEDTTRVMRYMEDVSHQLKTPLAVIRAICERTALYQKETSDSMDMAVEQVDKMAAMIRDLIQLGRFDCGKQKLHFAWMQVQDFLETVFNELDSLAQEKQLALVMEGQKDVAWFCDAFWMQEAVENILKNCIEHAAEGEIRLCYEQTERMNLITITDCGSGLGDGCEQTIFERYAFGGRTSKEGAGLGMSIAAQVIRLHFGTITAKNRPSGGAEFRIVFPRLDEKTAYAGTAGSCPV